MANSDWLVMVMVDDGDGDGDGVALAVAADWGDWGWRLACAAPMADSINRLNELL